MALSFIQKMRIRMNPSYIDQLPAYKVNNEMVEYAISHGYVARPHRVKALMTYPAFLTYFKNNTNDQELIREITMNLDMFSTALSDEYLDVLTNQTAYVLPEREGYVGDSPLKEISITVRQHFPMLLKTMRSGVSVDWSNVFLQDIPKEYLEEFMEVVREKGIGTYDIPKDFLKNPHVARYYMKELFPITLGIIKAVLNQEVYLQLLEEVVTDEMIDEHLEELIEAEKYMYQKTGLLKRVKQRAIANKDCDDDVLLSSEWLSDSEFFVELLIKRPELFEGKTFDISLVSKDIVSNESFITIEESKYTEYFEARLPEIIKSLARANIDIGVVGNEEFARQMLLQNPFLLDGNHRSNYESVLTEELCKSMLENGYVINDSTPIKFLGNCIDEWIDYLEADFSRIDLPEYQSSFLSFELTSEQEDRILQLCRENNYRVTTDSPPFLQALRRGSRWYERDYPLRIELDASTIGYWDNVAEVTEKVKKNPYLFFDFLGNNHNNFSSEQLVEIADIFMENLHLFDEEFPDASIIGNNPYIMARLYMQEEATFAEFDKKLLLPLGRLWEFPEIMRQIADYYIANKNTPLNENSLSIERVNPFILLQSITQDPSSIDFYLGDLHYQGVPEAEILAQYEELIKSGKYIPSKKTPSFLLRHPPIKELILANPENISFYKEENDITNEDIDTYYQLIVEGKYIANENTPEKILKAPRIFEYIINQDISNITLFNGQYLWDFSESKEQEIKNRIHEAIQNGTFVLKSSKVDSWLTYPDFISFNSDMVEYFLTHDSSVFANIKSISNVRPYIKEAIANGTYVVDESTPEKILQDPTLVIEALRKNKDILKLEQLKNSNVEFDYVQSFELLSILGTDFVIEESTPDFIKNNLDIVIRSLKNNLESARFCQNISRQQLQAWIILTGQELDESILAQFEERKDNMTSLEKVAIDEMSILEYCKAHEGRYSNDEKRSLIDFALRKEIVLTAEYPDFMRRDPSLIVQTAKHDIRFLDSISPGASLQGDYLEQVIQLVNNSDYVLSEKSPLCLKNNPALVLKSLERINPSNMEEFINHVVNLNQRYKIDDQKALFDTIKKAIREGNYSFSQETPIWVFADGEISDMALENDFGRIKLQTLPMNELSLERQLYLYELYQKNKKYVQDDDEVTMKMMKNSYFLLSWIRENPSKINEIDLNGIVFSEELKKEFAQILLELNYEVNEKTSRVIKANSTFLAEYLSRHMDKANEIEGRFVIPIVTLENLSKYPALLPLVERYDNIKSVHSVKRLLDVLGYDRAVEEYQKYGELIKYVDLSNVTEDNTIKEQLKKQAYRLPDIADKYLLLHSLGIDFNSSNLAELKKAIQINPDVLLHFKNDGYYDLVDYAIENGLLDGKTTEQINELLTKEEFCYSDNVISYYLSHGHPEAVLRYTGNNVKFFYQLVEQGLWTQEEFSFVRQNLDRLLRTNNTYARNTSILAEIMNHDGMEYYQYYAGTDESIFQLAIDNHYFDGKTLDDLQEELEYLFKHNIAYASSKKVMEYLIDYVDKECGKYYQGLDETVFQKIITSGFFEEKDDIELQKVIISGRFGQSSEIMKYLIENKGVEFGHYYRGNDEEIFKLMIHSGFFDGKDEGQLKKIVSQSPFCHSTEVMKHFIGMGKTDFLQYYGNPDEELLLIAINSNSHAIVYCADVPSEMLIKSFKRIMGEDAYLDLSQKNPNLDETLKELYSIAENSSFEQRKAMLHSMNVKLIDQIGLERYKTLLKYSYSHPMLQDVVALANEDKLQDFLNFYSKAKDIINDDKALGINRFLHMAHLYCENESLCKDVLDRGVDQLSDAERFGLEQVLYQRVSLPKNEITFDNLSRIIERERDLKKIRLERTAVYGVKDIKEDILGYLFGSDSITINTLLEKNLNTKTLAIMAERANKDGNTELEYIARYAGIVFEMIERVQYTNVSETELREFANHLYQMPIEKMIEIRKKFSNLEELVRDVYETEAQTELTDISAMLRNEKNYTVCETNPEVKIIDLSNKRHTIYGHVLGTDLDTFFDTTVGKVTICVSAETDKHEAYFYDDDQHVKLGFTIVPEGGYIGSSWENMGSSGSIDNNDFRTDTVSRLYNQKSIRNLYNGSTLGYYHSEILLYRQGLYPTCVIMSGDEPTELEIEAAIKIREKIKEITGKDVEIPLVKTQHTHNRVLNYEESERKEAPSREEKIKEIEKLRQEFLEMIPFGENNERHAGFTRYMMVDEKVYAVAPKSPIRHIASKLQGIVHGEEAENVIKIAEYPFDIQYEAVREVDAVKMYGYSRENMELSPKTQSMMLKEFMVDHLMFHYSATNDDVLLDENNTFYSMDKEGALENISDFINREGQISTNMTYFYFDASYGNNVYRKLFENYIKNPNEDEILSEKDLASFVEKAREIQEMNDEEYMTMFEEALQEIPDTQRELTREAILQRKKTLVKESEAFVQNLKNLREIEQNPVQIEDTSTVALINDIHGNAAALESLLEKFKESGRKDVFLLGDMIGFGPESNACLDILRKYSEELNIQCILGNHELYCLMGHNTKDPYDSLSHEIRASLSPENRAFLESLPLTRKVEINGKTVELAHYFYDEKEDNDNEIYTGHVSSLPKEGEHSVDYFVYGHDHRTESTEGNQVGTIGMANNSQTVFVNLPSSGCVHGSRASYVTIEPVDDTLTFHVHDVAYEQERTVEATKKVAPGNLKFFTNER